MASMFPLLFILLFPGLNGFHLPISPCPHMFSYEKETEGWVGKLKIQICNRPRLPLIVETKFGLKAVLKTKFVGLIELEEPPKIVYDALIFEKEPVVNYTVMFPLIYPLPSLEIVSLNGKIICSGVKVTGDVVTHITLKHKFPINTSLFDIKSPIENNFGNDQGIVCGKTSELQTEEINELTGNGEWPWLVAILVVKNEENLLFRCSGTLISTNHVITAGHCVFKEQNENKEGSVIVYFGKHDLRNLDAEGSQIKKVSKIHLHPEFTTEFYQADVAILQFSAPVEINLFVKPICLYSGNSNLLEVVGRTGTIAGWGRPDKLESVNSEPQTFQLPIVDQETCLRSRRDFAYITSNRTFCAGSLNGGGPCNGDSGGGLMIPKRNRKNEVIWELRGVVSLSLLDETHHTCDLTQYIVFTDVAKFNSWIQGVLNAK